jgi:hypothetical protein
MLPGLLENIAEKTLKLAEDTAKTTETVRSVLSALESPETPARPAANGSTPSRRVSTTSMHPPVIERTMEEEAELLQRSTRPNPPLMGPPTTPRRGTPRRRTPSPLMGATAEIVELNGGGALLEDVEASEIRIDHPNSSTITPLTIEVNGTGPRGWPLVNVAHYLDVNGDLVPDPLIRFEVPPGAWESGRWEPVDMTTSMGTRSVACRQDPGGQIVVDEQVADEIRKYARGMDANICDRFLGLARERVRDGLPVSDTAGEDD